MAIEKTGILVDTSSSFTNPSRFEEAGAVRTVSAKNLNANTQYYVKGYVIADGVTVYSSNTQSFYTDDTNIDYFTLSNAQNTTNYIELQKTGSPSDIILEYTKDGGTTWTTWNSSSGVLAISLEDGESVSFRGNNNSFSDANVDILAYGSWGTPTAIDSEGSTKYYSFYSSGNLRASGNIMTLVDRSGRSTTIPSNGCFACLFKGVGSKLLSAPRLPATTLKPRCYAYLFENCSITTAPELPATVMTNYCYHKMFAGTPLTSCPILSATTLAKACYSYMFESSSITSSCELPATNLPAYAYAYMFSKANSLTTARNIAATNASKNAMLAMFNKSGIISAPRINALTVTGAGVLSYIFAYCTSLESAQYPISFNNNSSYGGSTGIFYKCTALRVAPSLPDTIISSYKDCFVGCTSLQTAPELPATTIGPNAYTDLFSGCSNLTQAPSRLPAMLLKSNAYSYMFAHCVRLETAPEILATDMIGSSEMERMFFYCERLNEVKTHFTNWNTASTFEWLGHTSGSGEFYNLGRATIPSGDSGIPSGWVEFNTL